MFENLRDKTIWLDKTLGKAQIAVQGFPRIGHNLDNKPSYELAAVAKLPS